jgi:hypothetical protein
MSSDNSNMGKWLAGILAAIISGVVVFYLTEGQNSSPETVDSQSSSQTSSEPEPPADPPEPITDPSETSSEPEPPADPPEPTTDPSGTSSEPEQIAIGGNWQGVIYQALPNGMIAPYTYELILSQDGNSFEGNSTIQAPAAYGYSAVIKLRGSISDNTLSYDDGQMISSMAPPGWLWCQKSVKLTYDQNNDALQGTWTQAGCGSGTVSLSR